MGKNSWHGNWDKKSWKTWEVKIKEPGSSSQQLRDQKDSKKTKQLKESCNKVERSNDHLEQEVENMKWELKIFQEKEEARKPQRLKAELLERIRSKKEKLGAVRPGNPTRKEKDAPRPRERDEVDSSGSEEGEDIARTGNR